MKVYFNVPPIHTLHVTIERFLTILITVLKTQLHLPSARAWNISFRQNGQFVSEWRYFLINRISTNYFSALFRVTLFSNFLLYLWRVTGSFGARCWWCSWLKHCTTSRKAAGSIPDGVIGIFHWHISSGLTMNLGSTQPLREMRTMNWG